MSQIESFINTVNLPYAVPTSSRYKYSMLAKDHVYSIAVISILFCGCQKAVPALSAIKTLDGFSLNQNSKSISTSSSPIAVSGKCDSKFTDVGISFDQGSTWKSLREYDSAASINCTDSGTFTANVSISGFANLVSLLKSTHTIHVYFRGESSLGQSASSDFALSLQGSGSGNMLVAGSSSVTSGQYNLTGHIVFPATGSISAGYKLSGHMKARY